MSERNKQSFVSCYCELLNYLNLDLEDDQFNIFDQAEIFELFIRLGIFCVRIEALDYEEYIENNIEVFEKLRSFLS